jgi:alpha-L-rhamnosidase
MATITRTLINTDPFVQYDRRNPYNGSLAWPCRWVTCPGAGDPPFVTAYRLRFRLDTPAEIRLHITADERYELYLNGSRVGRGPERGDPRNWFYETYDLSLPAGEHVLAARTWALGPLAPEAQFSLKPGFLLCAEQETFWDLLNTGRAAWETRKLEGFSFTSPMGAFGVGHRIVLDAAKVPWGFEQGQGREGWMPAKPLHPGYNTNSRGHADPDEHLLRPALLPAMLDEPRFVGKVRNISAPALSETHSIPVRAVDHIAGEEAAWADLLSGKSTLTVPPHTRRRVIIDLENYYCAYPEVTVSGGDGGLLRVHWQESLYEDIQKWDRNNRDQVEGKYFTGVWWNRDALGDTFRLDGGEKRRLQGLWWSAGRYVEILVETDNQPLILSQVCWYETRYPYENAGRFQSSDSRLETVIPLAVRGLQMCSHETYMDCPYYEELMYVGDTRLECLVTYLTTRDTRLPGKALEMFALSRLPSGLTQSRYPSRERQIIPPFSLWWVGMLYDHLLWRGNRENVYQLMPAARSVLDAFTSRVGEDGLVRSPEGWNYIDWVEAWEAGVPPGGNENEVCGPLNWQYVYALCLAAKLEAEFGENELSARCLRLAKNAVRALEQHFWDAEKCLFADDVGHAIFTEHSQCLALLSDTYQPGLLSPGLRESIAANLFATPGLTHPTVYFLHYLFETCREIDRMDIFFERMQSWFDMPAYGFKTTYENANPHTNRSDCHAWAAHPLYHYYASILGIRPATPGFATVDIRPRLGTLEWASGTIPHPAGDLSAEFRQENDRLTGQVTLPDGITGTLHANGDEIPLSPGVNKV